MRAALRTASLSVCLLLAVSASAETVKLTVLFTSDVHAHVLPYDEVRERSLRGSLAQVATAVARVRAENPRTVVLDGGDAIQGTATGYYAIATAGADGIDPTIAAMNVIGYDAATVGNHEFNFGLDVLRRSLGQSRFPWLAANLGGADAARLPVGSELIIERDGVRVAVLGLTNPNIPNWDPPAHWRGLSFADPVEHARSRVADLRRRADVVIVVAHTGFERDPASGQTDDSEHENYAWRLAQLEGVDLLLTGHTHRDIPPQLIGRAIVAQPGRWADLLSRIDLELERTAKGWRIASWSGANLPMAEEAVDGRVAAAVEPMRARAEAELSRVLTTLSEPFVVGGVPTRDDASVDLIHAVQLAASGAQLSLAAPLAGSRTTFPAGPVTGRLAHALYPYPNTLVVVRLTGAELRDVLEWAVRGWTEVDCARPAGCTLLRERSLPAYNYDTLEGATYLVDPAAPVGRRIRGLRIDGRSVAPDQPVTLAVNSYRASGGGSYPHLSTAPRVREIGRPMVELLAEYLSARPQLAPDATDNWGFVMPVNEGLDDRRQASVK